MTKETEIEAVEPVVASRDEEIVETVVVDPPEPEPRADIEDVIATQDDPRAEIYKRHTEKRETEIKESEGGFSDEPPEIEEEDEENEQIAVENDESTTIIKPTPSRSATPPDADETITVRVAGLDRQVSKKKVDSMGGAENYSIRIAAQEQMERNAHERAANEKRKAALDEQERRLAERQAAIPAMDSQQGQPPGRSTQLDGQNLEEMARRYQEAVYDDAADAPSILAGMVSMAASTGSTFDKDEFRRQVKEEVLADQRQAKIVKASHALIDAHPELNSRDPQYDPRMFDAIDSETIVVEREYPGWEPEQVVQEAFTRIQKWKGIPQPQTMSDKQAQKKAMARPRVGTQRFQQPPPPPRPTNSDYVASERKRRGLD